MILKARNSAGLHATCPICHKPISQRKHISMHVKGVHGKTKAEARKLLKGV